ncbi:MAG TPA: hypothetical protein VJ603_00955 [Paucimonas sp.]|nr:hypothetical protein [Paucimonas sp.]
MSITESTVVSASTGDINILDYSIGLRLLLGFLERIAIAEEMQATKLTSIAADVTEIKTAAETIATEQTSIATDTAALRVATEAIATHHASIDDHTSNMDATQAEFLHRAATETLGIFMRSVWDREARLSRAVMMDALRQGNRLDNVITEITNPTVLPDGL